MASANVCVSECSREKHIHRYTPTTDEVSIHSCFFSSNASVLKHWNSFLTDSMKNFASILKSAFYCVTDTFQQMVYCDGSEYHLSPAPFLSIYLFIACSAPLVQFLNYQNSCRAIKSFKQKVIKQNTMSGVWEKGFYVMRSGEWNEGEGVQSGKEMLAKDLSHNCPLFHKLHSES